MGSFDALGFRFDVAATDARLIAYVNRLLATFAGPEPAEHHYLLRPHDPSSDDSAYELMLGGERVGAATCPEGLVASLVHDINQRAVGLCPHLCLHAGGVEHGGVGVVFPGEMEAGKTTLTTGLVRAGFRYLTDEAVTLDRDTQEIHPYPKPLSIDTGAWHLFPELEPHDRLASDAYKAQQWQVPPNAIRAKAVGEPCPVAVIVFPRYDKRGITTLTPIRRAEALVEITKHTFRFNQQAREALDILAATVRGADSYRLTTGDLEGAVATIQGLVGSRQAPEAPTR